MTSARKRIGWALLLVSLLPLPIVFCAYVLRMDHFAVFSVPPIWLWSIAAILIATTAASLLHHLPAYLPLLLWIGITFMYADEAKTLRNIGKPILAHTPPTTHQGKSVIRVATANCALFAFGSPAEDIAQWHPDIVLLQDAHPKHVGEISHRLFGSTGHFVVFGGSNGIASRWPIIRQVKHPVLRNQQATIQLPDQSHIEIVNLHLESATTDLTFWQRSTWTRHRIHRARRIREIEGMLGVLENTTAFPSAPVLLGGDFNSPATDAVHRLFSPHFRDSFLQAGRGWGNTYHRRFPILRIDALYHTPHFTSVSARTIESSHSDHRFVLVDYTRN